MSWNGKQLVVVGSSFTILASDDGKVWKSYPSGSGENLYGVTWGDNQFVAVGENGTILSSKDGHIWRSEQSNTDILLYDIDWNGRLYAAVGDKGTILTSPDGSEWTQQNSGTTNWLSEVLWTGDRYIVVGERGTILTSHNGKIWQPQSSATANPLYGVAWNGRQFIAVGRSGTILNSGDPDLSITGKFTVTESDSKYLVHQVYRVRNAGTGVATDTRVIYTQPDNSSLVSTNSTAGSCHSSKYSVQCDVGDLPAQAEARIELTVATKTAGYTRHTVSVMSQQIEANTANNSVTLVASAARFTDHPGRNSKLIKILLGVVILALIL